MTRRGFGPASSSACCCSSRAFARDLTTSGSCIWDIIESLEPGRGVAADKGDFGANGDRGEGDLRSVRKVFSGVRAGGGVAGGGVPASERLRGGCFDGGGGSSDGARGVAAGGAICVCGPASGSGSGSGVASASDTDTDTGFRVTRGVRFVRGAALGFGVDADADEASGSPERTRLPRVDFGVAAAPEDGPGVAVVRRDFRRGVGAGCSSNSSSLSSLTKSTSASGSESSDSTTFRREAAARLEGRAGTIDDMESTELNGRFVMGDGKLEALGDAGERGEGGGEGRSGFYSMQLILQLIHAMRARLLVGKSNIKTLAVLAAYPVLSQP